MRRLPFGVIATIWSTSRIAGGKEPDPSGRAERGKEAIERIETESCVL
jgi:hypothetical protein